MARRRAVEGEETAAKVSKPSFEPADFDEVEFLQRENRSAKMIYISLGIAIVAGFASFLIMRLALLFEGDIYRYAPIASPVLFAGVVLYLFKRFGIDLKALDWKKWFENGAMYILTWFVIWMLSMNPPFTDISRPQISEQFIELDLESEKNVSYIGYGPGSKYIIDDKVQEEADYVPIEENNGIKNLSVFIAVTDNWDLDHVEMKLEIDDNGEWVPLVSHLALNISKGRLRDSGVFHPSRKETSELRKVWSGGSEEVWEDNLYYLRLEVLDPSSQELRDQINLRLTVDARDSSSNERSREMLFSLKVA